MFVQSECRICRYLKTRERLTVEVQFYILHQLCLVYVCNPALQLLWMFREELEFGAVTFRMLPGVVITNFSWRKDQKKVKCSTYSQKSSANKSLKWCLQLSAQWCFCQCRQAEHGQVYLCSFTPHCTPSDDPDVDFSLQGGADQAAHL